MEINWSKEEYELVELPAINTFKELGYSYLDGRTINRADNHEVILEDRLFNAMKIINKEANDLEINMAIDKLKRISGTSLMSMNEKVYDMLTHYVSIKTGDSKTSKTIKFIDLDIATNNDFLVVNQLKIKGIKENVIPDLLVYLNGIPVGIFEFKAPSIQDAIAEGIDQLLRYSNMRTPIEQEGCEKLFWYNQIMVSSCSTKASIASLGAKNEHYLDWKTLYPNEEKYKAETKQEEIIYGVFDKQNLINIITNYIVYEKEGSRIVKKICRYQQFRAVEKTIDRLKNKEGKERSGVIWHTQGSGKSLTMVYLTVRLRREELLKNSTVVVVTDRINLDEQIAGTFKRAYGTEVYHSNSMEKTKELLKNVKGGVVVSTIFKFQDEKTSKVEVLTKRDDVIVLVDEAHRSQYSDMAYVMRQALPNASYIGFTGTPIAKTDKDTVQTFGTYIDKYPFNKAIEDGATVPIYYEARKPELMLEKSNLDDVFNSILEGYSDSDKEKIKQKCINKSVLSEIPKRIDKICDDLIKHYREGIEPNGYKAQVVSSSQEAAVTYYNKLKEKLQDTGIEVAVIISGTTHNDKMHIKENTLSKQQLKETITRFKDNNDPLKIIIVNNMLLTGFDAPIEGVMYVDRSLREHTLLQAVARTNRKYKNKVCGLIVDYYGISRNLKEALDIFTDSDIEQAIEDINELISKLDESYRKVKFCFKDIPAKSSFSKDIYYIQNIVEHFNDEMKREEFYTRFRTFCKFYDAVMPNAAVGKYRQNLKEYTNIYGILNNTYNPTEKINLREIGEKVKEIISGNLKVEGINQFIKPISLLDSKFDKQVEQFESPKTKAILIEQSIRHTIKVNIDNDKTYYSSILDKLETIFKEYNEDWEQLVFELEKLKEKIQSEYASKQEELKLSSKEIVIYNLLEKVANDEKLIFDDINSIEDPIVDLSRKLTNFFESNLVPIGWTTNDQKEKVVRAELNKSDVVREYFKEASLRKDVVNKLIIQAKNNFNK
jgi:type I restriction enzyme R subunit